MQLKSLYLQNTPGLAEINAPVGPQEVMPLLQDSPDSPLKTIAQCRLGQPISYTWMQVGPMMWCRLGLNKKSTFRTMSIILPSVGPTCTQASVNQSAVVNLGCGQQLPVAQRVH